MINRQVVLAARLKNVAQAEHFAFIETLAQPSVSIGARTKANG